MVDWVIWVTLGPCEIGALKSVPPLHFPCSTTTVDYMWHLFLAVFISVYIRCFFLVLFPSVKTFKVNPNSVWGERTTDLSQNVRFDTSSRVCSPSYGLAPSPWRGLSSFPLQLDPAVTFIFHHLSVVSEGQKPIMLRHVFSFVLLFFGAVKKPATYLCSKACTCGMCVLHKACVLFSHATCKCMMTF